jgi:hypothetical protein
MFTRLIAVALVVSACGASPAETGLQDTAVEPPKDAPDRVPDPPDIAAPADIADPPDTAETSRPTRSDAGDGDGRDTPTADAAPDQCASDTDCDDMDPSTMNTCSDNPCFSVADPDFCTFEPLDDAACDDSNVCTTDTCIHVGTLANGDLYGSCLGGHVALEDCCSTPADCVGPDACHTAACNDGQCELTLVPAPQCCLNDAACDDGKACNLDKCIGFNCKYASPVNPNPLCCDVDGDCANPSNGCVVSECNPETDQCEPPTVSDDPGCCLVLTHPETSVECQDNVPSTVNRCKEFACTALPNPSYCDESVNNCDLDNNPCTGIACHLTTNTCLFDPIPDCP